MSAGWRTWRSAMDHALYGDGGFYRSTGAPARHFRTSSHVTGGWASAWLELANRVFVALDRPPQFTVVEMGAGGGELLDALAPLAPPDWRLVGVDVVERPAELAARVEWRATPPDGVVGLLSAI